MTVARRYHVEGTRKFLYWALILLALGLWAVRDGWFPAASTMEKHPVATDRNFYLFNKSLAVISLVGAAVCGYVHTVVK